MKRTLIMMLAGAVFLATPVLTAAGEKKIDGNWGAIAKLETAKEAYLASVRAEAIATQSPMPSKISTGPAASWMKRIGSSEIDMATNRVAKGMSQVAIDGKTYYTAPGAHAEALKMNASMREARDPMTGKIIDKSSAVIFADAQGKVLYFSSDDSYKGFVALATPETIYGYSEPK